MAIQHILLEKIKSSLILGNGVHSMKQDIVIIGGGPAGMAAAIAAYDSGVFNILIIERDDRLGGI